VTSKLSRRARRIARDLHDFGRDLEKDLPASRSRTQLLAMCAAAQLRVEKIAEALKIMEGRDVP
jgi:hypothetical protein